MSVVARLDDHRRPPDANFKRVQTSAMARLQDCIDAIASAQIDPTAVVIGLARADAEPIIITADLTTLDSFDEIVDAANQVSRTVRTFDGPGSPTTDQLMAVIRLHWEQARVR